MVGQLVSIEHHLVKQSHLLVCKIIVNLTLFRSAPQRERERQTDRQTDRDTDRQTDSVLGREENWTSYHLFTPTDRTCLFRDDNEMSFNGLYEGIFFVFKLINFRCVR